MLPDIAPVRVAGVVDDAPIRPLTGVHVSASLHPEVTEYVQPETAKWIVELRIDF
ncbi:hypothetical protein Ssi02_38380 [Sinosporangium siamense]|uniref:Uncharacterized protein n=1 Tax=Sinosporangium siamense TaxID=1367973 RepID=A0A919RH27_9ACTN|nr:hypothetical protein Ssi02_38380 [Sinosporangium siamense]